MEIDKLEGVELAEGKPRWEDIPAGYNWRAQSYDGEWTAHYYMPRPHKNLGFWMSDCPLLERWAGAKNPLWNETLESRPPVVADGVVAAVGGELAAAVAEAQGWIRHRYNANSHWWWTAEDRRLVCEVAEYRPDINIAQAWELDGEGWLWNFLELPDTLSAATAIAYRHVYRSYVNWADFPSKPQAYATARCRAYLKAMAAE